MYQLHLPKIAVSTKFPYGDVSSVKLAMLMPNCVVTPIMNDIEFSGRIRVKPPS